MSAQFICEICGAVVQDEERHADWHESLRTVMTGLTLLAEAKVKVNK